MPWVEDEDPGGHMVVIVPSGEKPTILQGGSYADGSIQIGERPLTFTKGGWRAAFQSALGRKTEDYKLRVSSGLVESGSVNGTLRIEAVHSDVMRMISTLRSPDTNKPRYSSFTEHVPEAGIFHPEVCSYLGITLNETLLRHGADTRHMALTDFLFSPQAFMSRGSEANNATYIIIANRHMFLASNQTHHTLYDIAQAAGVQRPAVRPLENQGLSVKVSPGDHHVLDDMRTANLLTNRVVVITEEENGGWGNVYSGGTDIA